MHQRSCAKGRSILTASTTTSFPRATIPSLNLRVIISHTEVSREGRDEKEIYDEVTVSDVMNAADLLRDVYIRTNKVDGYVSIEVYPEYAHDPKNTILYARMIFERIGRPNIMIKVPGTKKGYEAIKTLIKDGINVNVTLLFSLEHLVNPQNNHLLQNLVLPYLY